MLPRMVERGMPGRIVEIRPAARHDSGVGIKVSIIGVLLVAVAAVLRFPTLGTQSLWADEGSTVLWIQGSFAHMLSLVVHNESSPPLYFCVAWLWGKIFGTGIVAIRSLSAVVGCATVAVAFEGTRRIFGLRVGVVLGLLMGTSAVMIWYSQEGRPYALLLLLCTLALIFWARVLITKDNSALVWWAIFSGLALVTHYFAVFIVAIELAILLPRATRERHWIIAGALLAASAAIIVPIALYQRSATTVSWISASGPLSGRITDTEGTFLVNGGAGISHAWWLGRLVILAAIGLLVWRGTASERRNGTFAFGLAVAALALPVMAALLGFDYFLPRYVLPAYLPLMAFIAFAFGGARTGKLGWLATLGAAALGVAVTMSINRNLVYQREDVRDVATQIRTNSAGCVVILQRANSYLKGFPAGAAFQYYAPSLRYLTAGARAVTRIVVIDEGLTPSETRATVARLAALGFHLARQQSRQAFIVYDLTAPHSIAVSRSLLMRDASFDLGNPLLLTG